MLLVHDLVHGLGNLAMPLSLTRPQHDGLDLLAEPFIVEERTGVPAAIASGLRVGVAGIADGPEFPWRFWIPGNKSVSAFKPGRNAPRA